MRSWSQLQTNFRELCSSGFDARLDHNISTNSESWHIAACTSRQIEMRFKALANMAGDKLLEVPTAMEWPEVAQETNPIIRWYRALLQIPEVCSKDYAFQKDSEGNDAGTIILTTISNLYDTSATLCMTLEAFATAPRRRAELLCAVPRYDGPCQHWRSAQSILADDEPDFPKAVQEAVSSVEGLCRIILGDHSITLGDALKRMKNKGLHPALAKSIEGIWGFASAEPGVRHGGATVPTVNPNDAQFIVEVCDAALVLLLALDKEPS